MLLVLKVAPVSLPAPCERDASHKPASRADRALKLTMSATRYRNSTAGQSRELVLVICALLLVALFSLTGILTRAFHKKQAALAAEWYAKGNVCLAANSPREALDDYRRALIFDPENEPYQLHLAQALAQLGRQEEARAYLLNLLSDRPGDGEVNFELARLAAETGNIDDAVRFYHAAVYGAWESDPVAAQLRARLELSQFLVRHGERTQAEAELMSLAANIPDRDAQLHTQAGDLFQSMGDLSGALSEYRFALKAVPENLTARIGAGMVSFKLGNYSKAIEDLEIAAKADPENKTVATTLETARLAIESDPFSPRLSVREKAQRVSTALSRAIQRADQCSASSKNPNAASLASLAAPAKSQRESIWSERNLLSHPDQLDPAMEMVFKIETAANQTCGEPSSFDVALQLIERKLRAMQEGAPE
jgi:tetratricopeptide (TPR) repeat protein